MLERSTVGALGLVVSALALGSLAHQPRAPEPAPRSVAPRTAPSGQALRALRDGERLELNRATAADLELLPGIGPALARRIVESRLEHGPFASPDALMRVRGIGPRTLARMRPLLRFDADAAPITGRRTMTR